MDWSEMQEVLEARRATEGLSDEEFLAQVERRGVIVRCKPSANNSTPYKPGSSNPTPWNPFVPSGW